MSKDEVMGVFHDLAGSQGLYGRVLRAINEAETRGDDLSGFWGRFSNCHDAVDVVMEIEG